MTAKSSHHSSLVVHSYYDQARVVLLLALTLLLTGCVRSNNPQVKGEENIADQPSAVFHRSYYLDQEFFDQSYQGIPAEAIKEKVYGVIVPHHLLASHLMAEFYQGLEEFNQPEVVVLIGPNHREVGDFDILSSRAFWKTPYGDLAPASEIINQLAVKGVVRIDERVFVEEHSISAEVAFIKKSFPESKLVPLVFRTKTTEKELGSLMELLLQILPERSLIIASVDFAHEVTSEEANELDQRSIEALQSIDPRRITEITVDSKPTISALFYYLKAKEATDSVLLQNSNAAKVLNDPSIPEVTSYITMYFR